MVPVDGSRGWPQLVQQYNTIYSKHISQDVCEDRASLSVIYTDSRGGWAEPSATTKQSRMDSWGEGEGGGKYHWVAFTYCTCIY